MKISRFASSLYSSALFGTPGASFMSCRAAAAAVVAVLAAALLAVQAPSLKVHPVDLSGKMFVVTGCTPGGIGYESAVQLALWNATVLCSVRNAAKGEAMMKMVAERLPKTAKGKIEVGYAEFASFKSTRSFAKDVLARLPRIDGILLNAGLHTAEKIISEDGLDHEIQANHYSQFLLCRLLEQRLIETGVSRLVFVSSGAFMMGHLDKTIYNHKARPQGRKGMATYGDSKLFNVLAAMGFAQHFKNLGHPKIVALSLAPGTVATNFVETSKGEAVLDLAKDWIIPYMPFVRNAAEGAARGIQALTEPKYATATGEYLADYIVLSMPASVNAEDVAWLWRESSLLVGESPEL